MLRLAAALVFLPSLACGQQTYLPQPDLVTAQARSAAQCVALKCDGSLTKYWWPVTSLKDGTAAVILDPAGPFSKTTTVDKVTSGLTPQEQSVTMDAATIASKLPAAADLSK